MIVLDQKETIKKAEDAFEDFCKWMKQKMGSEFAKEDKAVFRNVFVNGYMKALDDMVKMGKGLN